MGQYTRKSQLKPKGVHLSAADTVCELMNRLQCCIHCGPGPLQHLVTPALAVLVVVNAEDNACLHGGVVAGYSGN